MVKLKNYFFLVGFVLLLNFVVSSPLNNECNINQCSYENYCISNDEVAYFIDDEPNITLIDEDIFFNLSKGVFFQRINDFKRINNSYIQINNTEINLDNQVNFSRMNYNNKSIHFIVLDILYNISNYEESYIKTLIYENENKSNLYIDNTKIKHIPVFIKVFEDNTALFDMDNQRIYLEEDKASKINNHTSYFLVNYSEKENFVETVFYYTNQENLFFVYCSNESEIIKDYDPSFQVNYSIIINNTCINNQCFLDNQCYYVGDVEDEKFCSSELLKFIDLKEKNEICEFDYECKSGYCNNKLCKNKDLISEFVNLFSGLF